MIGKEVKRKWEGESERGGCMEEGRKIMEVKGKVKGIWSREGEM